MFFDLVATSSSLILPLLFFNIFQNHLDKFYTCKGDGPLFLAVFIYQLNRTAIFLRTKGGQFTAVTYLSVLSTLKKSNNK